MTAATHLNLHGLVSLALVDPPTSLVHGLETRLGPVLSASGSGDADIVVRFADQLTAGPVRHVGHRFAAYDDDAFYVLDRVTGVPVAEVPFDVIEGGVTITCTRSVPSVPLLFDLVNVVIVEKGYAPLHASAVTFDDEGVVLMGWPKGGKTGALLALMARGARFVGDEWVFVSDDGGSMLGLPTSVGVSEWQLESLPGPAPKLGWQRRLLFGSVHGLDSLHGRMVRWGLEKAPATKMLHKALPRLRAQLKVTRSPLSLFGEEGCVFDGRPSSFFLLVGHDQPDVVVEPSDPVLIADRMAIANRHEQRAFFDYYDAFTFAFPDRRNPVLDGFVDRQREMLTRALAGKRVFTIFHPYGGSLERLGERVLAAVESGRG